MTDARQVLENELGSGVDLLDGLDPEEAADLVQLYRTAQVEEAAALVRAVDETINGLPRLFRGPARKVVFPGGK